MLRRLTALIVLFLAAAGCLLADALVALSPGQLARRLRSQLKEYLAAEFDFESVAFSFSDGLVIRGIKIGNTDLPALAAKRITLRIDLWEQQVNKILIEEPSAFVCVKEGGATNFDHILRPRRGEAAPAALPKIEVRQGTLEVQVEFKPGDIVEAMLENINAGLKPGSAGGAAIVALAAGRELGNVQAAGTLSPDMKAMNMRARADGVELGRLKALLPKDAVAVLDDLQLDGKVDLSAGLRVLGGKVDFEAAAKSLGCTAKYRKFPLPLCEIAGTVRIEPGELRLVDFSGNAFGNPFTMQGKVSLGHPKPRAELEIVAPGLRASEEILQSMLEKESRIIREFSPEGSADVTVRVLAGEEMPEPRVSVLVDVKGDASISYHEFPYRLEKLKGTLLITPERVEIRDITSSTDGQKVTGSGCILPSGDGVVVDVAIMGEDVRIDEKLRTALTEEDREVWDTFRPSGTAGVQVRITSPADNERVRVAAEVLLDGHASALPTAFPLAVSGLKGRMRFSSEGPVELIGIRGSASGGTVEVADTSIPPGENSEASINVSFSGVSLGEDVVEALASAVEEDLSDLQAGGSLSGRVSLHREEGAEDFTLSGEVILKEGWMTHGELPLKAEKLAGRLILKPDRYDLRCLTGRIAGGRLEAWGEIRRQENGKDRIRLRLEGFEMVADQNLESKLPEDIRATYREFQPYGSFDAAVWLDGTTPLSEGVRKILKLRLRDMACKYAQFPYQVYGVAGEARVDIDEGKIALKDLHTKDRSLTLNGAILTDKRRTATDLHIEARSLALDKALRDAMPEEVLTLWKDIELEGVSSGTVTLHIDQLADGEPAIEYDILLKPEDASLHAGFLLEKLKGKVTLTGRVTPEGRHILKRGLVQFSDFTVSGLPVTWASSLLELTDESLTVAPITGRMANGTLLGTVKVSFDKDTTFSGMFDLKDASVKIAAQQLFGEKMDKTTGRAEASITFKGKGSDESSLTGDGKVKLTRSNLWEVPFFSKLVKALSLGAVPSVDFSESYGKFKIEGGKLIFSKVYFHSPILNLNGAGELSLDGRMSFTFKITVFSNWLSKIDPTGLSSWVLKIVEGELNAVRATGTAKKVTIQLGPKKWLDTLKLFESSEKNSDR
jgi:hypothetical protein